MNEEEIKKIYEDGTYIKKNPSLHIEDSKWKSQVLIPFIDIFLKEDNKNNIKILDIGGGAGLILKSLSDYIIKEHNKKTKLFALDLSSYMLDIQKKNNPDLIKTFNMDVRDINLNHKMDLVLMIDVLEHVSHPMVVLNKLRIISNYVIFKVPLESNFTLGLLNFLTLGYIRRKVIADVGHINVYNLKKLRKEIESNCGEIIHFSFANVYSYYLTKQNISSAKRVYNTCGKTLYNFSPKLSSLIFNDFVIILVRCKNDK